MTNNHIEHLGPALIRPGRVNRKLKPSLAEEHMIRRMFLFAYGPQSMYVTGREHELCKMKKAEDRGLPGLAQRLVAKVTKLESSSAEITSLLLITKQSPTHSLARVETWMDRVRDGRNILDAIELYR
jgi:chaperone BCS1